MDNEKLLDEIAKLLEQQTHKISVKIENDVTKRIDALFDGYKLTHEKQWELERQMEQLAKRIELLELKAM